MCNSFNVIKVITTGIVREKEAFRWWHFISDFFLSSWYNDISCHPTHAVQVFAGMVAVVAAEGSVPIYHEEACSLMLIHIICLRVKIPLKAQAIEVWFLILKCWPYEKCMLKMSYFDYIINKGIYSRRASIFFILHAFLALDRKPHLVVSGQIVNTVQPRSSW